MQLQGVVLEAAEVADWAVLVEVGVVNEFGKIEKVAKLV